MKTQLCFAFLFLMTTTSLRGQATPLADPIKGVWKLNVEKVEKSKDAQLLPESEVITITSKDASYKLNFDVKQSNGFNPKYDVVTEMEGASVKPISADGTGTNALWRVTRRGAKKFDMELLGGWTDKYEVSLDGKTMTLHRVQSNKGVVGGYIRKDGTLRPQPEYVAVFDRAD